MTHDDPYIIQTNLDRFHVLLRTELSEPIRVTVHHLIAEFEGVAALRRSIFAPSGM
jgi:hypothetical protein